MFCCRNKIAQAEDGPKVILSAECSYQPETTKQIYEELCDLGYNVELNLCSPPFNFDAVQNASILGLYSY